MHINTTKWWVISFIFSLALLLLALFLFLKDKESEKREVAQTVQSFFQKALESEKINLLSLRLALSENGTLKEAIIDDDETKAHRILSRMSQTFQRYLKTDLIRLQVITPDKFLFARSWVSAFNGTLSGGFVTISII